MSDRPVPFRAMLTRFPGFGGTWRDTLEEPVREYLTLDPDERSTCALETTEEVTFAEGVPSRKYLNSSMIERLAERLAAEGRL